MNSLDEPSGVPHTGGETDGVGLPFGRGAGRIPAGKRGRGEGRHRARSIRLLMNRAS